MRNDANFIRRHAETLITLGVAAIYALAILAVGLLLGGCRSVRYVPVESVRHDSAYVYKATRDSVHLRDSVFVLVKGDTVYQYRYRYLFVGQTRADSAAASRVDTIRVPYPVEIEKRLTLWQRVKLKLGGSVTLGLSFVIVWLVYRNRRR
ncbi:MAG: hypothetical protein LBN29_11235 [Mediterranea sp.]|jgi:hypothetical protein|nr:hypothetical protein [Mediterranea sp.]